MRRVRVAIARWLPVLALTACVGERPTGSVETARTLAQQTIPFASTAEATAGPLTIDACVARAFAHAPGVRAALARAGVAQAEWSLTVLPSEPELTASALFPIGGGDPELEAALALDLLDLLRIPARRDVADAALRAAVFDVARACVAAVHEVQETYVAALAADEAVLARERIAQLARTFAEALDAQVAAGAARATQAEVARLALIEAELARDAAIVEARAARRALAQRIGLEDDGAKVELVPFEPGATPSVTDEEFEAALARRLDVRVHEQRVEEARAALELAGGLSSLGVGAGVLRPERADGAAREPTRVGPSIALPLPWFGRKQARIEAARAELEWRAAQLDAVKSDARRELRDRLDEQARANLEWQRREREVEPKARELAERAQAAARAGQIAWLDAHAAQVAAQEAMLAKITSGRRARTAALEVQRWLQPPPASRSCRTDAAIRGQGGRTTDGDDRSGTEAPPSPSSRGYPCLPPKRWSAEGASQTPPRSPSRRAPAHSVAE
jgi:outer membrane protein TolC